MAYTDQQGLSGDELYTWRVGDVAVETGGLAAHPLDRHVRLVLQAAMLIFVYTIAIGILNGLDLVEFTRQQLLSHLHSGTLGWMTLAILGATLWLFAGGSPLSDQSKRAAQWFTYLAIAAIALYIGAFATTTGAARPLGGTLTLVALTGVWIWALARVRGQTLTVPHLLVLLGLTASVLGGAFGVLNGLSIAFGWDWVPSSFFGAHPATMEVGFIIPAAFGVAEWALRRNAPPEPASRAGKVQAGLLFLAFGWVLLFTLLENDEVAGLGIIFGIIAVIVFFVRMWRTILPISWLRRTPDRHAVVGSLFGAVTFVYIFTAIQLSAGDFEAIPHGQIVSFIHLLSVGGTTNALLAFIIYLSQRTRPATILDDVVFWGVNIGVIGFVTALTADLRGLIPVFVPIMGASLLTAIAIHVVALSRAPSAAPPAAPAAPAPEAEPVA